MNSKRSAMFETILTTIVALLVLVLVWGLLSDDVAIMIPATAAGGLVVIGFAMIRFTLSPDRVRANQTKRTLKLASKTLGYMRTGLSPKNAQEVCKLLLPETQGITVAITDHEEVLGVAGEILEHVYVGSRIKTRAAQQVLASKELVVVTKPQDIGPIENTKSDTIPGAIVAALVVQDRCVGTLKIYYEAPHLIDKTQVAIARGLAKLLSTQLSLAELDRQSDLARDAELKALQSQINPHFLFNTLNTIAALIRTDPRNARLLVREFSRFYRQTLENSHDFIPLEREIEQTMRYMRIEIARFGEDRVALESDVAPETKDIKIPAFIIQPIVENSVQHAMPSEGRLTISIQTWKDHDDLVISVADNGVGMDEQTLQSLVSPTASEKGTGIALMNVKERLKAFFGTDSAITIAADEGCGTVVNMRLSQAYKRKQDEMETDHAAGTDS